MQAETACATGVECETFHKLESFISTSLFLKQLELAETCARPVSSESPKDIESEMQTAMDTLMPGSEVLGSEFLNSSSSGCGTSLATFSSESFLPTDDFVVIDKEGAIEAMAYFIAETLMRNPQAVALTPKKLQDAVIIAIQSMKQSRFKKVCSAGRSAYRWGALGYSAFQMYSNPWLCQALVSALITFGKMTLRC